MESSKLIFLASALTVLGPFFTNAAPGIFDVFGWGGDGSKVGAAYSSNGKSDAGPRSDRRCVCDGSWCRCCVDLSLAGYIDVGGPGCVDMKYLSQADGVKLNVTYGDSKLHGAQVKVGSAVPICMDLLSDLAQVCASMKNLRNEGEGLYGCVSLEPTLLGDVQDDYSFGCFNMGADGIVPDAQNSNITENAEEEEEETTEQVPLLSTVKPGAVNEETLISAINESAEDGIAWFTGLLGDIFGGNKENSASASSVPPQAAPTVSTSAEVTQPQTQPSEAPQIVHIVTSVPEQQQQQQRSLSSQQELYSEIP